MLDRFSSNMSEEVVVLGRIVDELGPNVRVVSVNGRLHSLVEAFMNFLGSGYQQRLVEYPMFDLRFFKRCLNGLREVFMEL